MSMKILIVDDSNSQRKILNSFLEEYEVFEADGGLSAIDSANKNLPDIIIMNVRMPGVSGISALEVLKRNEKTKDIPIVMTSETITIFEQNRVFQFGASDLLAKPFIKEKVLEAIKIAEIPYFKHCLEKELDPSNQNKSPLVKI